MLLLTGCIERYYPDEEELRVGTMVVSAHLDNIPGNQSIQISRSVPLNRTLYEPEGGCYVEVMREDGEARVFPEASDGVYEAVLEEAFLREDAAFKLVVITPGGEQYESEFETLHESTPIESIYYQREDHPTADPEVTEKGIRFYMDFKIDKEQARYLRWEVSETYEIQNPNYPTRVYGEDRRMRDLPDSGKNLTCWVTGRIPQIYTLDLLQVEGTVYREWPLHFVTGTTQRLHHRYSVLVRQYSLSEKAFRYWNELAKNLQSKGGLFDTQPALTPSNICNVEDEEEQVIGYFSISGAAEKRIFVQEVPGLELYLDPYYCAPGVYPMFLWRYPREKLPLYLATASIFGVTESGEVKDECVDCTQMKGATAVKPDFW